MKRVLCFLTFALCYCFNMAIAQNKVQDFLNIGDSIIYDGKTFYLGWSSHPTDIYYLQEYFPKGESPESYNQMMSISILENETYTPKNAVSDKAIELTNRKKTDACCNYCVYHKKKSYIIDFLVSQNDPSNPEHLSIVEFDVHRYDQVKFRGKKALQLTFISERAYGNDIFPFLKDLKPKRCDTILKLYEVMYKCK